MEKQRVKNNQDTPEDNKVGKTWPCEHQDLL